MSKQCQVWFSQAPHYLHYVQCSKNATTERVGVQCCGTHARQADKWDVEGEGVMERMVLHWWGKR